MANLEKLVEELSALTVLEAARAQQAARREVGRQRRRSGRRRCRCRRRRCRSGRGARTSSTSSWPPPATRRSTSSRRCARSPASASRRPRTWSKARPKAVKEGVPKADAEKLKAKLEAEGAKVELK